MTREEIIEKLRRIVEGDEGNDLASLESDLKWLLSEIRVLRLPEANTLSKPKKE